MPLIKNASPTSPVSPSALKAYLLASRPKTWIASISPVVIGASLSGFTNIPVFLLTLLFSLLIQVGTNYANDYFDFINGADSQLRNGPKRAVQQGWISPASMLLATLVVFGIAFLIAIPLMILAGLWSLFIAVLCIAFGILYTGGPKPLGYLGLGEILVFLFFGPVATCGTYFLQMGTIDKVILLASLPPGLLSCSILIANNLRDEKSDRIAGKRTLIVKYGRRFGSWEYTLSVASAAIIPLILVYFFHLPKQMTAPFLILPLAYPLIKKTFQFRDPLELISVLQGSSFLQFLYTLLFSLSLL